MSLWDNLTFLSNVAETTPTTTDVPAVVESSSTIGEEVKKFGIVELILQIVILKYLQL